jgi:hypothetical protein
MQKRTSTNIHLLTRDTLSKKIAGRVTQSFQRHRLLLKLYPYSRYTKTSRVKEHQNQSSQLFGGLLVLQKIFLAQT